MTAAIVSLAAERARRRPRPEVFCVFCNSQSDDQCMAEALRIGLMPAKRYCVLHDCLDCRDCRGPEPA